MSTLTTNEQFIELTKEWIEHLLRCNPEGATFLGDHRYDALLNNYSLESIHQRRSLAKSFLERLHQLSSSSQTSPAHNDGDIVGLSGECRVDYGVLVNQLKKVIFEVDELKEHEWNTVMYNVGGALYYLLARDFAPLESRLLSLKERLKQIPSYYATAKQNLKNPPKIHTETAILQNQGNIPLITKEIDVFLEKVPYLKPEFKPIQDEAVKAINEYITWLEKELLPQSSGDFRLGHKWQQKLHYTLESNMKAEEILERALRALLETQQEMISIAKILHQELFPLIDIQSLDNKTILKSVLDKLAEDCPNDETVVGVAEELTQKATDFVRSKDFVTVPSEPVAVIVMPEFLRGVNGAYCDPPGPLEPEGKTFYAISPTPSSWTEEKVCSFYREYNNSMLTDLTVHEAMPGHYLQFAHANKVNSPTLLRSIYVSGTFCEGWAVYCERVMADMGFGGLKVKLQQLKMYLRVIINSIIDQKIHTAGMTEEEAINLLTQDGFQEHSEAANKWTRACVTSAQLSTYFVGNVEVCDISKLLETTKGLPPVSKGGPEWRKAHDEILSYGTIAPKYIKEGLGL